MSAPPFPNGQSTNKQSGETPSLAMAIEVRRFLKTEAPADFELALALRTSVFIEEQGIPPELEYDEFDEQSTHWLLIDPVTLQPMATGRVLPYQEACQARPVAKLGRIAVSSSYRGQRLGQRLMGELLTHVQQAGYEQAILDAQTRVMPFYEKLGFVKEGFEFMEADIPHYRMRLVFKP
ncbi:GNAT family N-acetyltransferase [Vampirovibrio sp.]|uniref:GNAT family N-acetyltransferase n=1 Tax=Vampirovibrio sp. TaxID=2717857 RepID=UPI003593F3EB